jgi:RecA/RadA recombinase
MSSFFNKMLKVADNKYAMAVEDGNDADVKFYVDTGSYTMNAILSGSLYGGLPGNKVTALAGEPSTGKTFYLLHIIKNFLNVNPEGYAFYFESESAITTEMLEECGIDTGRFVLLPVSTIEEFRSQASRIVDAYLEEPLEKRKPMFMALDSLGMLSTNKEVSDIATSSDKRDMTKPGLVKGAFRVLTLKLGRAQVPLVVTNHLYNVIGAYIPTKTMGGGDGLPYAASTTLYLSKSKKRDKTSKEITGAIISMKNIKARLTVENREVDTLIDFMTGLNKYYGLLEIAKTAGLIDKDGSKYKLGNVVTSFTTEEAFENGVYKNPEKYFTTEVMGQLELAVHKEFKYGSAQTVEKSEV